MIGTTSTPEETRRSRRSELRNGLCARSADFQTLVKDIAMHIAAQNPLYVRRDEVPVEELTKEKEIYKGSGTSFWKAGTHYR
jgi:translation elongation factor EF-Ts